MLLEQNLGASWGCFWGMSRKRMLKYILDAMQDRGNFAKFAQFSVLLAHERAVEGWIDLKTKVSL